MTFETYFKASSYFMIGCAMLALMLAGGLHVGLGVAFVAVGAFAWQAEGSKWQLSERVGLVIVLFSIPLFFLDWHYQRSIGEERLGVNALAHLITFLAAVKLLQVKSDRDWVFLYLISFFEVLLAAGLSLSPIFLATFGLYLPCAISTVIAFEIRKARRGITLVETRLLVPPDARVFRRLTGNRGKRNVAVRRLPLVACALICLIVILALPLFLIAPRAGSPGITRSGGGLSNFIGFSETVSLGAIGELKQNDEVVMRVRLEDGEIPASKNLKWRGVALDEFTGKSWRKSASARQSQPRVGVRGFFRLGTTDDAQSLTTQTIFLEPLDSTVLFAAPRALAIQAVQGDLPYLRIDGEGAIQTRHHDFDRIIYKAFSDVREPHPELLRRDTEPYSVSQERYLQLPPELDQRVAGYARTIVTNARAVNRYDKAKAIESHFQESYGYSLQMTAAGPDPLADFLFRVRAGHCEYFSTAMTVMLRREGIAARVVNGFLPGEYNGAADAYTVRQSDAHSWVEVYFPGSNAWVTFDPTPAAGRTEPQRTGFTAALGKYAEAFELLWFQYVVGYDRQEQRTLATSLHNQVSRYQNTTANAISRLQLAFWPLWRQPFWTLATLILFALIVVLLIRWKRLGWRGWNGLSGSVDSQRSAIEFYERLIKVLAARGIKRESAQTPMEFAAGAGLSEAITITRAYNRVRFGAEQLSAVEIREIEAMLERTEREVSVSN
ncbi:MAG: transglutaminase TgpA family protein [Pyrinomonadaceae bacterium]